MTAQNPKAIYACVNLSEPCIPPAIKEQSIGNAGDIGDILKRLSRRPAERPASPAAPVG